MFGSPTIVNAEIEDKMKTPHKKGVSLNLMALRGLDL
tara:strand:- start:1170 stop:1280 length:111 start_codon:yes stop_codon:yes gene_type:complete